MAIFGPKAYVNPFGKISIFPLFALVVFIAQKGFFSFQNIAKHIFLACISLKKEVEKWPFFLPKPWLNPFGKISIFGRFELDVFIGRKAFYRCRMSQNTFSWPILAKKENLEKWPFLDQKHRLTPLEKSQFFNFLNFLFLQPRKTFVRSRIS